MENEPQLEIIALPWQKLYSDFRKAGSHIVQDFYTESTRLCEQRCDLSKLKDVAVTHCKKIDTSVLAAFETAKKELQLNRDEWQKFFIEITALAANFRHAIDLQTEVLFHQRETILHRIIAVFPKSIFPDLHYRHLDSGPQYERCKHTPNPAQ